MSIQRVMQLQRDNRYDATFDSMARLRSMADREVTGRLARYRRQFRLGAVPWIDNQHHLTDGEMSSMDMDGEFMKEQATFLCNLDTGEVWVVVNRFTGQVARTPHGNFPSYMTIRPGEKIIDRRPDGTIGEIMVPGKNPFPSLEEAYDWCRTSPFASNGELPPRQGM